jgi:hypothetical protein
MTPEDKLLTATLIGFSLWGCWRVVRWFGKAPVTPNPWDEKTEESLNQPDATPLCRRCLESHDPDARYCSNCGLPVDSMVPLSPFHQAFALGDVLLTGTQRRFPVNWLTITGYVLLSMLQYLIFAPFYWFFLFRNVRRLRVEAMRKPDLKETSSDMD